MDLKVNIDTQQFAIKMASCQQVNQQAMPQIYQEFVANTPVGDPRLWKSRYAPRHYHGGNARRNTTLQGNRIYANYPYASVLNDGRGFRDGQVRGSVQAPQGMVKPTIEFARRLIKRLMQQKGK